MAWTPELKEKAIQMYKDANPTAENSTEIVQKIKEDLEIDSVNGVRMILVQAGVYLKKAATAATTPAAKSTAAAGDKRVSKESQIGALKAAIEELGQEIDEDILGKLTGKAAAYFTSVIKASNK